MLIANKSAPTLSIVIHTEEEFDWDGGFYKKNTNVTHGQALYVFCEKLIKSVDAKITLALDYAFVASDDGQQALRLFKDNYFDNVEFATHLHPWVNPPHDEDEQGSSIEKVSDFDSYPGNLRYELEFEKLKVLTDKIESVCGVKPTTYLAGRYGIGSNTTQILKQLGYKVDISISPYCDFTHQEGPDFSHFNNSIHSENGIKNWPHTTAVLSIFPFVTRWFNKNPAQFEKLQKYLLSRLTLKLLRVKRQRLSPEGFDLQDLKNVVNCQINLNQPNLIFSFHSPSVVKGLTPYVQSEEQHVEFYNKTIALLSWFKDVHKGHFVTIEDNEKLE